MSRGKDSGPLNTDISVPILIADSQGWSQTPTTFYGQDHFTVVKSIAETSLNRTGKAWFMTQIGASHASITDASLIDAALLPYFDPSFNGTIDPNVGLSQYVNVSAEFLGIVRRSLTDVLAQPVTDPEWNVPANTSAAGNVPDDVKKYWEIHVAPSGSK